MKPEKPSDALSSSGPERKNLRVPAAVQRLLKTTAAAAMAIGCYGIPNTPGQQEFRAEIEEPERMTLIAPPLPPPSSHTATAAPQETEFFGTSEPTQQEQHENKTEPTPTATATPEPENTENSLTIDNLREFPDSPYTNILNSNPLLKPLAERISNMWWGKDGKIISVPQTLINILENDYDPLTPQKQAEFLAEITASTEEKAFFAMVAQSLWVEHNKKTPWSLNDFSDKEIEALYYMPELDGKETLPYDQHEARTDMVMQGEVYPSKKLTEEKYVLLYPLAQKLQGTTIEKSVENVIRFVKGNFFHAYKDIPSADGTYGEDWGWDEYADGRTYDPENLAPGVTSVIYSPLNIKRLFEERIAGCHEPVLVMEGLLRAMNIPVFSVRADGHGTIFIPQLGQYIHGDNLVMLNGIPVKETFVTPDVFDQFTIHQTNKIEGNPDLLFPLYTWLRRDAEGKLYVAFKQNRDTSQSPERDAYLAENFPDFTFTHNPTTGYSSSHRDIKTLTDHWQ